MSTRIRATLVPLSVVLGCMAEAPRPAPGVDFMPPEPATTGNKWVEDESLADGSRCFVLADEECGATDAADYLDYFEAPIFRTGHAEGDLVYAVDGSNIWAVDVSDPSEPRRIGIVAGAGRALAITGHAGRLHIAAAEQGLVIYLIDPDDPLRLHREHQVTLPGPALDVALSEDGLTAYVAAGSGGLVIVPLKHEGGPFARRAVRIGPLLQWERRGFASGVAVSGGHVYAAGCSGLAIIDGSSEFQVGWMRLASNQGEAPLPVKDVAVADGIAYVAAGRWGVVFVDVSDPARPRRLGNYTEPRDLLYYANGVTISHGHAYVAAGDWGVDRISLAAVPGALSKLVTPTSFARYCSEAENPDRRPTDDFRTSLPPPRQQDPLDVLSIGDTLVAFGDASRLGVRALDLYRLPSDGRHALVGRYEEPRLVSSIAAAGDEVAVAGKFSGLFVPTDDARLLDRTFSLPEAGRPTRVVALTENRRVIALDDQGALVVDGQRQSDGRLLAPALLLSGSTFWGVREEGTLEQFELEAEGAVHLGSLETSPFRYGVAHAVVNGRLWLASGDWEHPVSIDLASSEPVAEAMPGGLLSREDLQDSSSWRSGAPRRLLVPFGDRVAEVVSFGGRAGGLLHADDEHEARPFVVPPGTYVAGIGDGQRLWLVQGDRARYRTAVIEVDFTDADVPRVTSQLFIGSAVGAARLGDRLYVADQEAGVRGFEISEGGLRHLGATHEETSR